MASNEELKAIIAELTDELAAISSQFAGFLEEANDNTDRADCDELIERARKLIL